MEEAPPDTDARTPSSRVLQDLLQQAPADTFTLGWLLSRLQQRSFGIVILFLGLLATAPIGSVVPGLMLLAVTIQMIAGRREPVFPQFITGRSLPTRHLLRLGKRAVPVLQYLEKVVHPRWPLAFEATKRFVGLIVLLLTLLVLLTPVPMSNIAPAIVIAVTALAYIEEDGLLLCLAVLVAVMLFSGASAAVWGTIVSAMHLGNSW
jgi:hypothetical protein